MPPICCCTEACLFISLRGYSELEGDGHGYMITLEDVSFSYKDKPALDRVSLQIAPGESVAVIGPNGSGKSTLLKLLNGIIYPVSGSYIFDGEEITEKRLKDSVASKRFHQRIGFVFQHSDTQLFCSTVYEEVAFGPMQMGLPEQDVKQRVHDCLDLLQIRKLEGDSPYQLSGGEKKKVAIASVLSLNPEILVLDEPMNGIDPKGKKFLRDFMIRLNRSGKTIICATHDFSYVEGIFDRAVVFSEEHGIVRDGPYDEIVGDEFFLTEHNII